MHNATDCNERRMRTQRFLFIFCALGLASSQVSTSAPNYLVRLEHSTFEEHACALLQHNGAFHLEIDHGDEVKVFEGSVPSSELVEIERELNDDALAKLSQREIEEPLIWTPPNELGISVYRKYHQQDLHFQSSYSQQPFRRSLEPLVHWLDNLHKEPHRELSEDEGKNNCLPSTEIVLKKREANSPPKSSAPISTHVGSAHAAPVSRPQTTEPESVSALLLVYSSQMKTESAHQSCVLIGENGKYRFEDRTQKAGKPVNTQIIAGQITSEELQQLHQILEEPELTKIQHRKPPGGMVVPMMGDMLSVSIARTAGAQQFILSSAFGHPEFPSFYSGDANITNARALLKFLTEHVESNKAGALDAAARNNCTEAP